MAWIARWHADVWIAIGTVVIAIFTTILGISTTFLWLSTRALVEGAEKTAERQLRAYISVLTADIVFEGNSIRAVIEMKNFGQTPAYEVGTLIYMGIAETGISDSVPPPLPSISEFNRTTVGPSASTTLLQSITPPPEGVKTVQDGTRKLFVWGKAEYRDAFSKSRDTNYRMQAIRVGARWALQPTKEGNTAT